jgi:hypothetical protein
LRVGSSKSEEGKRGVQSGEHKVLHSYKENRMVNKLAEIAFKGERR